MDRREFALVSTAWEAIQKGRPMIAAFGERYITTPLGGLGLGQG